MLKGIAYRKPEAQAFDCSEVLDALRRSDQPRSWSSLAAELLGIERSSVGIKAVRGIRDCVRDFERDGKVREVPGEARLGHYYHPSTLLFVAV